MFHVRRRAAQKSHKKKVNLMANRITSKQIGKAIEEATGFKDVAVYCADGVCHFYSDTNEDSQDYIYSGETNSVLVCRLSHQSIEQWVESFKAINPEAIKNRSEPEKLQKALDKTLELIKLEEEKLVALKTMAKTMKIRIAFNLPARGAVSVKRKEWNRRDPKKAGVVEIYFDDELVREININEYDKVMGGYL